MARNSISHLCWNLQQNGIVERKYQHLLSIARAILFKQNSLCHTRVKASWLLYISLAKFYLLHIKMILHISFSFIKPQPTVISKFLIVYVLLVLFNITKPNSNLMLQRKFFLAILFTQKAIKFLIFSLLKFSFIGM